MAVGMVQGTDTAWMAVSNSNKTVMDAIGVVTIEMAVMAAMRAMVFEMVKEMTSFPMLILKWTAKIVKMVQQW